MKRRYVPPSGNPNARMAIVGEQPGEQEVRRGRPFVGPAGQGLDECLTLAKIPRQELYLTNVIKDYDEPLSSYIDLSSHGKYTISPNGFQYIQELGDELAELSPNVVVALGNIALIALTNRVGITKWRSSVLECTMVEGMKVIPTFHPATFIPPKFNFLNKPLIVNDLQKAAYESAFPEIQRKDRHCHIKPSFEEAVAMLNHCYEVGSRGATIDIDLEVINGEVDCFSITHTPDQAMSIPLRYNQGDYFNIDQEYEILLLLAKIMESRMISKRGANFIFDTQFLLRKYGMVPRGELHCTQIAQKILLPDFAAGLDFVTSYHTDIPYYKQDGKQWMKMGLGSWEEWWQYNSMDVIATSDAHPKQHYLLEIQGNLDTYNRQRKLIKPLIYMAERGIKVDVAGILANKEKEKAILDTTVEKVIELSGDKTFNPNSSKQVMALFYETLGVKPYRKRNQRGQYVETADVDALKRIARKSHENKLASEIAQTMLDIRGLSKRISTYMNIGKVDKDGRSRSSYKPVGADTGRIASGETIFGTGGNQQNWPHDLLRYFVFDEGYIGYAIDLSQIENRIVAYVGGVISQIQAFETGIDLHRLTASVICRKPYDEISSEDGSSPLGDGRQSERFWGKKGNHATNYDVGVKTFALKNEMREVEAKQILDSIHRGYPQIREGYHVTIQNMLKNDRTVTNLLGRNRLFLGPVFTSPTIPRSAVLDTYRQAYAHLPQSTTADKINEYGIEYVYYNPGEFGPIELLAQIHDSIVFQIPLSVRWTEHAVMIKKIINNLQIPLQYHSRKIPTPADLSIGLNMRKDEMIEIKSKDMPDNPITLAKKLEQSYEELRSR